MVDLLDPAPKTIVFYNHADSVDYSDIDRVWASYHYQTLKDFKIDRVLIVAILLNLSYSLITLGQISYVKDLLKDPLKLSCFLFSLHRDQKLLVEETRKIVYTLEEVERAVQNLSDSISDIKDSISDLKSIHPYSAP